MNPSCESFAVSDHASTLSTFESAREQMAEALGQAIHVLKGDLGGRGRDRASSCGADR
jgi:hypothetical protein